MDKNNYYVYYVTLEGEVVYVGKGKENRYKHTTSGKSHNQHLNELWFRSLLLGEQEPEVSIIYKDLSEKDALDKEHKAIMDLLPRCNIIGTWCPSLTGSNLCDSSYLSKEAVTLESFIEFALKQDNPRAIIYHRMYYCEDKDIKTLLKQVLESIPDKRENNGGHNIGFAGKHFKGDSAGKKAYGRYKKKFIKDHEREPTENESLSWLEIRNNKRKSK